MLDSTPSAILQSETLPFPFNNRPFCRYEPIEKRIAHAKVLIVNDLLRYDDDLSELARKEWNGTRESKLRFERKISGMACDNIAKNVLRLVQKPKTLTVHLSEVGAAAKQFEPDAIVMSGTLSDFDYYNPAMLEKFAEFVRSTTIPILAICGAHQLVGTSFGNKLTTLDHLDAAEKRADRLVEYQYRFIKITDRDDPIFEGIGDVES
ncbi:MAG: hypothetical protein M3T96_00390, partial [Acidobacteriota bacterium]|nr:hypothetical protein [Acidobacteriota bacterium]